MGQTRRSSFCGVLVINVLWLVVGDVERDYDHYLMMCAHRLMNGHTHKHKYSMVYHFDTFTPCTV